MIPSSSPRVVPKEEILLKGYKTPVEQYVSGFWPNSDVVIENVDTQVELLSVGQIQMPITINDSQLSNSYVCSPYTALVPYAAQELGKLKNPLQRILFRSLMPFLGWFLRRNNINRNVHINNWLLSTNLFPENLSRNKLENLTRFLLDKYPSHSLIFRSLNAFTNSELISALEAIGYLLVPSRQVYIYGLASAEINKKRDYRADIKLLRETPYQFVDQQEISLSDRVRIVELYNMLYLDKYSIHNPQFTDSYIERALTNPHFKFFGFRNEKGVLDAFGGHFTLGEVTTMPLIGYDTSKPLKDGLYRLVTIQALLSAQQESKIFNCSSGAPSFKRLRGAASYIEYSAIYIDHLPKSVQRMWRGISHLLETQVVPLVKKLQL